MSTRKVPLEYLRDCSNDSMQNFMAGELNKAAEIRKGIRADLELMVEALVNAEVARVLMFERETLKDISDGRQQRLEFAERSQRKFRKTA